MENTSRPETTEERNLRLSKYDLTDEEYEKCLKTAELAIFMNQTGGLKHPTSKFVVAQPGAGKTGLRAYVGGGGVEFNPDEIAMYHKYYNEILEEFPKESYQILQRFVRPALDTYLRSRAVQLRTNIMQEGTLASTQSYIEILDFQKNGGTATIGTANEQGKRQQIKVAGGYYIDINALAVHRYESLLSSYEREQDFIEKGLPPRAVTAENHDRAYANMLETLKIIEQKKLYDRIRVFRRGKVEQEPQLVFTTGDNKYPSAVEAILQEREKNRREILANPQAYMQRIKALEQRVRRNQNTANAMIQLGKLQILKKEFAVELEEQQQIETHKGEN